MNLTELRDELTTRAGQSHDHSDLMPGVRRKVKAVRYRRTAGAVATAGLVTALAAGVISHWPGPGTPQPAGNNNTSQPSATPTIVVPGGERVVKGDGDQITLPEFVANRGRLYALSGLRTASAVSSQSLSIPLPQGQPFLVSFGTTDTGPATVRVALTGVGSQTFTNQGTHGAGIGTEEGAERRSGTATVKIETGRPTKGRLVLGIYTPVS